MDKLHKALLFLKAYSYEYLQSHGRWNGSYKDLYSSVFLNEVNLVISEVQKLYKRKLVHTRFGIGIIIDIFCFTYGTLFATIETIIEGKPQTIVLKLSEIYLDE